MKLARCKRALKGSPIQPACEFLRSSRSNCQIVPTALFWGTNCAVGPIEAIETQDNDEARGR